MFILEALPELIHVWVEALTEFAVFLDNTFRIPWPIPILAALIPITVVLSVIVWWLRGTTYRVICGYNTTRKKPCENRVWGEWAKCHVHRAGGRRDRDGILIDPQLPRWQIMGRDDHARDNAAIQGRGFLRRESNRTGLLYYHGFARSPRMVLKGQVFPDLWRNTRKRFEELRLIGWRGLVGVTHPTVAGTSANLVEVIRAVRAVLALTAVSLIMIIVSISVPRDASPIFEYLATYGLIAAWATGRFGVFRVEEHWSRSALKQALKWIIILTLGMTLAGLIDLYKQVIVDVAVATVAIAFIGISLLLGGAFLYYTADSPRPPPNRRRHRRRRPRPR